jgi:hypothetical protein
LKLSASHPLVTNYKSSYGVNVKTKLYAEWNLNNFFTSKVTDNGVFIPDEDWDTIWPKASVVSANRPSQGIVRGRISTLQGFWGQDAASSAGLKISPDFIDKRPDSRYYLIDNDDHYKYWSSYKVTTSGLNQGLYYFQDVQSLAVVYDVNVKTNKIVIGLEASEAVPKRFRVETTTNGQTWSTAVAEPPVGVDGRVSLWWNGGAWRSTEPTTYDATTTIRGIRLVAEGMSKQSAPLSVIEMGARYQQDLSDYLISESSNMEISDVSNIAPIGIASSNKASIQLDNTDGRFYNENPFSPYAGLLDSNVKMWCDYIINDNTSTPLRQWTMFAESWANQMSEEVSVELYDNANYLQQVKIAPVFWEGLSVGSIIWRLMDMAGVADWNYTSNFDDVTAVPYYWNDPEKTVWENIQDIASTTQTAVYFDCYNVAQIKNAHALFNDQQKLKNDWQFEGQDGSSLADIITVEKTGEFEANQIEIKYKEVNFSEFGSGLPKMEVVWEPEGTVTLRACALSASMTATQMYFSIPATEAATWPIEGLVNIEGEIIAYKGKQYRAYAFFDQSGAARYTSKTVYSEDERKALDETTPEGIRWRNGYSGYFEIVTRGDLGTSPKSHTLEPKTGYTYELVQSGTQAVTHWSGGVTRNAATSTVTLRGREDMNWNYLYTLRTTDSVPGITYRYGTRMRFPSAGQPVNKGAGGLYIKGGSNNSGFFIDLAPTDLVESTARATRNELRFQIRMRDGNQPMKNYIPPPTQINRDTWYDVEAVCIDKGNATMQVVVLIDGVIQYNTIISGSEVADWFGHFGVFIRDNCIVEFDYLYAVGAEDTVDVDNASFYDNVKGGYLGTYFDKVVPYQNLTPGVVVRGTRTVRPQGNVANQTWLDEFGPVVHEVRRYDVDFEKSPVAHSFLYYSNTEQAVCPVYVADSFGASFYLANTSRRNVIISGEDTLTFGSDNSVDQKIFIYGSVFNDNDQLTETVKDEVSMRKRGVNALSIESNFIQSKAAAKKLGEWILKHQSNGTEEYHLEVFGNPFLELGDVITINYDNKYLTPTQKFVVVAIDKSSQAGIETSLTVHKL